MGVIVGILVGIAIYHYGVVQNIILAACGS